MPVSIIIHFNYFIIIYLFYIKVNKLYKNFYNYSFFVFVKEQLFIEKTRRYVVSDGFLPYDADKL